MKRNFEIPAGGDAILRCSRYTPDSEPRGLIVIAHGFKGFKDWGMFPYAAEQLSTGYGYEVVTFTFSHAGVGRDGDSFAELEKFARNTYEREQQDMALLLSYIQQHPQLGSLPLFLMGHSRGGGNCLLYALDHPGEVSGVISWNGLTDLDLFTAEQKDDMRLRGRAYVPNSRTGQQMPLDAVILEDLERQKERYNLLERLQSASFPVILVQGTEDSARLLQGSQRLVSVRPDIPWIRVPEGNHTFGTVHPFAGTTPQLEAALDATAQFMEHTLAGN